MSDLLVSTEFVFSSRSGRHPSEAIKIKGLHEREIKEKCTTRNSHDLQFTCSSFRRVCFSCAPQNPIRYALPRCRLQTDQTFRETRLENKNGLRNVGH